MDSETSGSRGRLKKYCLGMGLDIGYGGDPITPKAIAMDLPQPYNIVGNSPQHLAGDARSLYWFKDSVLDYVYSSHLLEDFTQAELPLVLSEWLRVIKPKGHLVLLCPNQLLYLIHCGTKKTPPNPSHKIKQFGLEFLLDFFSEHFPGQFKIIEALEPVGIYSFLLVLTKTR